MRLEGTFELFGKDVEHALDLEESIIALLPLVVWKM